MLTLKPKIGKSAKVLMSETGTAHNGNQRRAPALEEKENDDDDQDQRLNQRVLDCLHPLGHGERGVEADDVFKIGRKLFRELRHRLARFLRGRDRV